LDSGGVGFRFGGSGARPSRGRTRPGGARGDRIPFHRSLPGCLAARGRGPMSPHNSRPRRWLRGPRSVRSARHEAQNALFRPTVPVRIIARVSTLPGGTPSGRVSNALIGRLPNAAVPPRAKFEHQALNVTPAVTWLRSQAVTEAPGGLSGERPLWSVW